MNSNDNLFEDIEQDNNPSFYGNQSILDDPYGNLNTFNEQQNNIVNNSIVLSNKINQLIDDPNLKIDIISSERLTNSSIIVYSIELSAPNNKSIIVKRRYSEFKSLRDNLLKLFPTLIIPPIPEKHSILTYLVNSINNTNELSIIESRKRYFKIFLIDLIFDSNEKIKNCVLLHKFLDPNYELNWLNALNEPPVNLIPNNLLLANPINPTDQNGLYSLLPLANGFEFNSNLDNLPSLKKLNDDIVKLNEQIELFELNDEHNADNKKSPSFGQVPTNLINFEVNFNKIVKILHDLCKLNSRSTKNFKSIINNLIELGGNLNNFSLQIYDTHSSNLSLSIEKFGSTIDSSFLNFEGFLFNSLVPEWQEPIHRLIQYFTSSLQLIKFYKFKIIQFKLLHKLRFNKFKELSNFNNNFQSHLNLNKLKNLDIESPTINRAIKKIELQRQRNGKSLTKKSSWYGLFGGSKQPQSFTLENASNLADNESDVNHQYKYKINHIEKELNKLDQLIQLANSDMINLSNELNSNFNDFLVKIEKKWLRIMLDFIRNGQKLFNENLHNWVEFKEFLIKED